MPDAEFPEEKARHKENQTRDGTEGVERAAAPTGEVQKGIILEQSQRNDKREESQNGFAVDGKGIHPELPPAVGENIHEFQPLNGEKAEGGVYDKQSREDQHSAEDHQN